MSLLRAIRETERIGIIRPGAFAAPTLALTSRKLEKIWNAAEVAPNPATIAEVVRRFRHAFDIRSYDALSRKDWRMLPWALWAGEPPLAADAAIFDIFEQRLRTSLRCSDVKTLISAYLRDFAPERPNLDRVARLLAELCGNWDWPWCEHHRELRLFDPREAPARVAARCMGHADGAAAMLADLGLDRYPVSGLALHALLAALSGLRAVLEAGGPEAADHIGRIMQWSTAQSGPVAQVRGPLADALLCPWSRRALPESLKERIQAFLLKHYGDPRTRPARWQHASEEARAVFRKWLVKVALDQFLDVIDELAFEQHWKYRRAFWMAYFRRDWISEAHVMFGSLGYAQARRRFGQEVPCASLTTGSRRVEPGHAVLLMRIGRLVIADWSHNGRCAIWNENHPRAPRFGLEHYTSADVDADTADWNTRHAPPEG